MDVQNNFIRTTLFLDMFFFKLKIWSRARKLHHPLINMNVLIFHLKIFPVNKMF